MEVLKCALLSILEQRPLILNIFTLTIFKIRFSGNLVLGSLAIISNKLPPEQNSININA